MSRLLTSLPAYSMEMPHLLATITCDSAGWAVLTAALVRATPAYCSGRCPPRAFWGWAARGCLDGSDFPREGDHLSASSLGCLLCATRGDGLVQR